MTSPNNPLLDEIRRIAQERDRLEQRERRTRYAIDRAIVMLRDRPERRVA